MSRPGPTMETSTAYPPPYPPSPPTHTPTSIQKCGHGIKIHLRPNDPTRERPPILDINTFYNTSTEIPLKLTPCQHSVRKKQPANGRPSRAIPSVQRILMPVYNLQPLAASLNRSPECFYPVSSCRNQIPLSATTGDIKAKIQNLLVY